MSDLSQLISDFWVGNEKMPFAPLLITRLNAAHK